MPTPPPSPASLLDLLSKMGDVTPSQAAAWLDAAALSKSLLCLPPTPAGVPPEEVVSPLWGWLQEAGSCSWGARDAEVLDRWCGSRLAWWLHPADASGQPLLDAWLTRASEEIVTRHEAQALLDTVPTECFLGLEGAERLAVIMRTERALARSPAMAGTHISTPASDSLLARGADPFVIASNLAHVSSRTQVALLASHHRQAAAAWLGNPRNCAAAMHGQSDPHIRAGLRAILESASPAAAALAHATSVDAMFASFRDQVERHQPSSFPSWVLASYPELPQMRDSAGRTAAMAALTPIQDAARSQQDRSQVQSSLGALAHVRVTRQLFAGRDHEGRTLWPYLLRALTTNRKRENLPLAIPPVVHRQAGPPAVDAAGFGLVHQVLYDRDEDGTYAEYRIGSAPFWSERLAAALPIGADLSPWLGAGSCQDLPGHLLERMLDVPTRQHGAAYRNDEVVFLCEVARALSGHAQGVPPSWRSLFLNANVLNALLPYQPETATLDPARREAIETWLLPDARLAPGVRAMVARHAAGQAAQDFGEIVARADTLSDMNRAAVSLAATHTPRPRRLS